MRGTKSGAAALAAFGALVACAGAKVSPDAAPGPAADAPVIAIDASFDAAFASRSFTVDTAGDLAADTGTLTDTVVESWGAVEPIAWYTGGLVQRASDTGVITDAAATTWAQVQAFPTTGRAGIQWATSVSWGDGIPPGVGLTSGDDFTIWDEGELWLEAGTWTFSLYADDHGFVELASPRTSVFTRVVSSDYPDEKTGTFVAVADGWYPFRYADSDHTGGSGISLRMSGPSTALAPIPRDRLRARIDDVSGMVETAFDDSRGTGDVASTIDPTGAGNVDWMMGNPPDLGITSSDTFGVRWTGQLRIDVGGAYTFRYASDDGQRLWIDGAPILDAWDDMVHDQTSGPVMLDPGWHDVVIDHSENGGSAAAHLTIASGPELAGMPLPPARLRAVEGREERVAPGTNHADVAIPDLSTAQQTIGVVAPLAAVVRTVDVSYEINHGNWGDLVVTLKAPNGATAVVRNRADAGVGGDKIERFTIAALAGAPVAGTWTLLVQDAGSGATGTLLDFEVTPHFTGGTPPIPATASFESVVHDLGASVASIDKVGWIARVPAGAGLSLSFRTGADAASCITAPWSAPMLASGGAPAVATARYFQYRVDFTSDGDHGAALESLRVDYSIKPF